MSIFRIVGQKGRGKPRADRFYAIADSAHRLLPGDNRRTLRSAFAIASPRTSSRNHRSHSFARKVLRAEFSIRLVVPQPRDFFRAQVARQAADNPERSSEGPDSREQRAALTPD